MTLNRTHDAVEREDEARRDEQARAIYERWPNHTKRMQMVRSIARNGEDLKDLEERLLALEDGQEIEKAARHVLWDLDTPEQREQYLMVQRDRRNAVKHGSGTVWAMAIRKRVRQLALVPALRDRT